MEDDGDKKWFDQEGKLHRDDGPAVTCANGYRAWYRHDKLHRDNGPAIESPTGWKEWFRNGQLHREDGPAIEGANGSKEWWRNGKMHREDGPAIEWADGTKVWCRDGEPWKTEEIAAFQDRLAKKEIDAAMAAGLPRDLSVSRPLRIRRPR